MPHEIAQSLNAKLNMLKVDWQDVFSGQFFDVGISLSGIELIELAETWDLQATRYNPMDRDLNWRMTYEIRGKAPAVAAIAQIIASLTETRL